MTLLVWGDDYIHLAGRRPALAEELRGVLEAYGRRQPVGGASIRTDWRSPALLQ